MSIETQFYPGRNECRLDNSSYKENQILHSPTQIQSKNYRTIHNHCPPKLPVPSCCKRQSLQAISNAVSHRNLWQGLGRRKHFIVIFHFPTLLYSKAKNCSFENFETITPTASFYELGYWIEMIISTAVDRKLLKWLRYCKVWLFYGGLRTSCSSQAFSKSVFRSIRASTFLLNRHLPNTTHSILYFHSLLWLARRISVF